jgi:hypothetical protein
MDFDFLNWIGHVPHKLLRNKIFFLYWGRKNYLRVYYTNQRSMWIKAPPRNGTCNACISLLPSFLFFFARTIVNAFFCLFSVEPLVQPLDWTVPIRSWLLGLWPNSLTKH